MVTWLVFSGNTMLITLISQAQRGMRVIGLNWWIALVTAIVTQQTRDCGPTHQMYTLFGSFQMVIGQNLVAIHKAYYTQKAGSDRKVVDYI